MFGLILLLEGCRLLLQLMFVDNRVASGVDIVSWEVPSVTAIGDGSCVADEPRRSALKSTKGSPAWLTSSSAPRPKILLTKLMIDFNV